MGNRPKFDIGQIVVNKVKRIGSYEPSTCQPFTKLTVDEVRKRGDRFEYVCTMDGYVFAEDELMTWRTIKILYDAYSPKQVPHPKYRDCM